MAEFKINMEAVEEVGAALGFLFAAFIRGFETGTDAFGILEEEEAIKDIHETDIPPNGEAAKTEIGDCRKCWCDQCARLEECKHTRENEQPDGTRPFPCTGCGDGMRFKPCEENCCEEFVQGVGLNNG